MGLQITIPKGDLAKGIPISNGWAKFEIVGAIAKPSKDGGSVNYVITHKLVDDVNERQIDHNFNSKVLGMMAPWLGALSGKSIQEVLDAITSGALQFDFDSAVGKQVMGKVEQQVYEGRILSKIVDFAPLGKIPF